MVEFSQSMVLELHFIYISYQPPTLTERGSSAHLTLAPARNLKSLSLSEVLSVLTNLNLLMMWASPSFMAIMAYRLPIQFLGPCPKARKEKRSGSLEKLSGSKTDGL